MLTVVDTLQVGIHIPEQSRAQSKECLSSWVQPAHSIQAAAVRLGYLCLGTATVRQASKQRLSVAFIALEYLRDWSVGSQGENIPDHLVDIKESCQNSGVPDQVPVLVRMLGGEICGWEQVEHWHVYLCLALVSEDEGRLRSLESMVTHQQEECVLQC